MLLSIQRMAKKRKTKQEKIILQLKRQLAKKTPPPVSSGIKLPPRQEANFSPPKIKAEKRLAVEKPDVSVLSYDPKLIKRDLAKTLFLSLAVISLEFVLYLALR
jgi:hypothetical protein